MAIKSKQLVKEYRGTFGVFTYAQRDCIGSIWKILEKYGAKTSYVGSNWFARHELRNIRPLTSKDQLYDGCAVLKTLLPGESGYNLPVRYKDDLDQIDYNHIGIGTDDGHIYDSTRYKNSKGEYVRNGPGLSTAKIGPNSWDIIADFEDVDYSDRVKGLPGPGEIVVIGSGGGDEVVEKGYAFVVIPEGVSGNTVKVRAKPSAARDVIYYEQLPSGTMVRTGEIKGDWQRVTTPSGKNGWMMRDFLSVYLVEGSDGPQDGKTVDIPAVPTEGRITVSLTYSAANELFSALKGVFGK